MPTSNDGPIVVPSSGAKRPRPWSRAGRSRRSTFAGSQHTSNSMRPSFKATTRNKSALIMPGLICPGEQLFPESLCSQAASALFQIHARLDCGMIKDLPFLVHTVMVAEHRVMDVRRLRLPFPGLTFILCRLLNLGVCNRYTAFALTAFIEIAGYRLYCAFR